MKSGLDSSAASDSRMASRYLFSMRKHAARLLYSDARSSVPAIVISSAFWYELSASFQFFATKWTLPSSFRRSDFFAKDAISFFAASFAPIFFTDEELLALLR